MHCSYPTYEFLVTKVSYKKLFYVNIGMWIKKTENDKFFNFRNVYTIIVIHEFLVKKIIKKMFYLNIGIQKNKNGEREFFSFSKCVYENCYKRIFSDKKIIKRNVLSENRGVDKKNVKIRNFSIFEMCL